MPRRRESLWSRPPGPADFEDELLDLNGEAQEDPPAKPRRQKKVRGRRRRAQIEDAVELEAEAEWVAQPEPIAEPEPEPPSFFSESTAIIDVESEENEEEPPPPPPETRKQRRARFREEKRRANRAAAEEPVAEEQLQAEEAAAALADLAAVESEPIAEPEPEPEAQVEPEPPLATEEFSLTELQELLAADVDEAPVVEPPEPPESRNQRRRRLKEEKRRAKEMAVEEPVAEVEEIEPEPVAEIEEPEELRESRKERRRRLKEERRVAQELAEPAATDVEEFEAVAEVEEPEEPRESRAERRRRLKEERRRAKEAAAIESAEVEEPEPEPVAEIEEVEPEPVAEIEEVEPEPEPVAEIEEPEEPRESKKERRRRLKEERRRAKELAVLETPMEAEEPEAVAELEEQEPEEPRESRAKRRRRLREERRRTKDLTAFEAAEVEEPDLDWAAELAEPEPEPVAEVEEAEPEPISELEEPEPVGDFEIIEEAVESRKERRLRLKEERHRQREEAEPSEHEIVLGPLGDETTDDELETPAAIEEAPARPRGKHSAGRRPWWGKRLLSGTPEAASGPTGEFDLERQEQLELDLGPEDLLSLRRRTRQRGRHRVRRRWRSEREPEPDEALEVEPEWMEDLDEPLPFDEPEPVIVREHEPELEIELEDGEVAPRRAARRRREQTTERPARRSRREERPQRSQRTRRLPEAEVEELAEPEPKDWPQKAPELPMWQLERHGPRRAALEARRARTKQRIRIGMMALGAVSLVAATTVVAVVLTDGSDKDETSAGADAGPATATKDTVTTSLMFGTREEGRGALWATLLTYDEESGRAAVVFLPPHTAAEVPGRGLQDLSSAFQSGGVPLLLVTTENLLGVAVDRYVELSNRDASLLFEATGPLSVTVPNDVRVSAGENTTRLLFSEGRQRLPAQFLVKLLYLRGVDGDDIGLGVRHLAFWDALLDLFESDPAQFGEAIELAGAALAESDTSVEDHAAFFEQLASVAGERRRVTILPVSQISVGGSELYQTDPDELASFVEDTIGRTAATGDDIRVQILNGNGVPGIGEEVAQRLVGQGFRLILGGNTRSLNHKKTLIVTYDSSPEGQALAEQAKELLGVGEVQVSGQEQGILDLTIVVGKDFLRTL